MHSKGFCFLPAEKLTCLPWKLRFGRWIVLLKMGETKQSPFCFLKDDEGRQEEMPTLGIFSQIALWHRCGGLGSSDVTWNDQVQRIERIWTLSLSLLLLLWFVGICQSLLETNMETWSKCCLELEVELYLTQQPLETCEICLQKSSNSERVLSTANTQLQGKLSLHAMDKPLFTNRRDDLYTTHWAPLNSFWTFSRWCLLLLITCWYGREYFFKLFAFCTLLAVSKCSKSIHLGGQTVSFSGILVTPPNWLLKEKAHLEFSGNPYKIQVSWSQRCQSFVV